jgi:hypothetical protein
MRALYHWCNCARAGEQVVTRFHAKTPRRKEGKEEAYSAALREPKLLPIG